MRRLVASAASGLDRIAADESEKAEVGRSGFSAMDGLDRPNAVPKVVIRIQHDQFVESFVEGRNALAREGRCSKPRSSSAVRGWSRCAAVGGRVPRAHEVGYAGHGPT